jgi:septin family protein
MLDDKTNWQQVVGSLLTGLPHQSLYIHLETRNDDLDGEEDQVPTLSKEFQGFLLNVPAVEIKHEQVQRIDTSDFDKMSERFEKIIADILADKKKLQEIMQQDKERHEQMIKEMQARQDQLKKEMEDNKPYLPSWATAAATLAFNGAITWMR